MGKLTLTILAECADVLVSDKFVQHTTWIVLLVMNLYMINDERV